MPIAIADKIVALIGHLSPADIEALPPAERRRLADQCRHVAKLAEEGKPQPKAGILGELRNSGRGE
jgi:hypothetical protein